MENDDTNLVPIAKAQLSSVFDAQIPTDFIPQEMDVYSPTRLDYFAARALQGLLVGRSPKDRGVMAKEAVSLANELVELLDQT